MTTRALVAALLVAAVAGSIVHRRWPPPRRLGPRIRTYTGWSRSRLGTGYADPVVALTINSRRGVSARVLLHPLVAAAAGQVGRFVTGGTDTNLELRLARAGWSDLEPDRWRRRQLGLAVGGLIGGLCLASVLDPGPVGSGILVAGLGFWGATHEQNRMTRAIERRQARMRTELYTVAQLLAIRVRTGHGPADAVRLVASFGRGPVVDELREGLTWISGGVSPRDAWSTLAGSTAEPLVARLHRLLAASSRTGGDITGALRALADDARTARRDELARRAVARRTAMLLPLLGLIAPVMFLFVAAAIPSIVFGAS